MSSHVLLNRNCDMPRDDEGKKKGKKQNENCTKNYERRERITKCEEAGHELRSCCSSTSADQTLKTEQKPCCVYKVGSFVLMPASPWDAEWYF